METIKKAAEITGASVCAIRQAVKGGRLTAERRGGHLFVDPAAVAAVCTGKGRRGRSGIPGVTWCEQRKKWRAVCKCKIVYECDNKTECASALAAYKEGRLETIERDLPINIYHEGKYYKVQIKRKNRIVFTKFAATVEEAVAIRNEWRRGHGEM